MAKHLRCYVSLCSGAADAISVALAMATLISMKLRSTNYGHTFYGHAYYASLYLLQARPTPSP